MALLTTEVLEMKRKEKQNISEKKIEQRLLLESFLKGIEKIKSDLKKEEELGIKILIKILNKET